MAIVAGVDFGTLSVRVSIVDSERGILGSAIAEYTLHRKREDPEYATQSHEDHMRALASATREAVKQAGRSDVKVIGLGLPNNNKRYVHEGITDCIVLWNTMDLGYLTVYTASALDQGTLKPGDKAIKAGRLGQIEIAGDNILLGKPFIFTRENIDKFDF